MSSRCRSGRLLLLLVLAMTAASFLWLESEGRYLPTRSAKTDRLDKLRELLRELIEGEIEKEEQQQQLDAPPRWHPETKLFYKRQVDQAQAPKNYNKCPNSVSLYLPTPHLIPQLKLPNCTKPLKCTCRA